MDSFTVSKGDRIPNDLAALRGARLVSASETEEGRAWAEARIKSITGGDPISARFMNKDFFTYLPQFKLTIVGNHKPMLSNVDDAVRRRFNIVPFDKIPAHPDRQLEEKLKAEWPGILRWMIEGCADWLANGLLRPESVVKATNGYFADQDVFGNGSRTRPSSSPAIIIGTRRPAMLQDSWRNYAKAAGEEPGTASRFAENMTQPRVREDREEGRWQGGPHLAGRYPAQGDKP